ncbi:hypothetical protein L6E12_24875 [Actinokineospora sp. PR83]|uniref:hypothetical protein n=1 Tax=Actinokineospora sp. PR83 TaxID=2884908 RepID=UPI001F3A755A|nr:hypothetical protein [Actinokineospora sp. PR83]MCG8919020.1 hypothetical protein [Actinokineospora sp. PR83]
MTNPILSAAAAETTAGKTPVKHFLEGAGLLQDSVGGLEAIFSGDFWGGAADLGVMAMDVKAFAADPLQGVLSIGFGWLIEYIGPIKDCLDWLTGNQDALDLTVQTWLKIGEEVQKTAEEMVGSVNTNCASWSGPAVEGYRAWAQDQADIHVAVSNAATGVAKLVDLSKSLLNTVRGIIRGIIADVLAKLVSILYRYVPPAYPVALAAEGIPLVLENATKATKVLRKAIDAFQQAVKQLGKLGELLSQAAQQLKRGVGAVDIGMRGAARHARGFLQEEGLTIGKYVSRELRGAVVDETVREMGVKYLGPRVGKSVQVTVTGSTDPGDQPDLGESREKQREGHRKTRIEGTASGGVRITGEL